MCRKKKSGRLYPEMLTEVISRRKPMGLQVIFTFIFFFLSFFEGGGGEGYPCVPMEPSSKMCHKLQVGKREQSLEVI